MIVATFNVENLFERPRAMNLPTWQEGQPAITAAGELNALFNKRSYGDKDKRRMLHLLGKFDLLSARPQSSLLEIRKIRGQLRDRSGGEARIAAAERESWTGWVDLKKEHIADEAITNTAALSSQDRTRTTNNALAADAVTSFTRSGLRCAMSFSSRRTASSTGARSALRGKPAVPSALPATSCGSLAR